VLLDTSGLLCCFDRTDARHGDAEALFYSAPRLVTHGCVLAEFVPLCDIRGLPRPRALDFVRDLMDNPDVEVLWVGESLHRSALALLRERLDKDYSLCDAVSFLVMRRRGITQALTTDRHFEQEGFVRLLPP
jgi:predicted nucleic acid-binding protein